MLIKLTNTLNSIVRRVLGVIKDGLKMWLPFESSGSDTSGNSNNATLYTGKALSFDGVNDYVDLGSQSMPNTSAATFVFWCNPTLTSSTGNRAVIRYGKSNIWFNNNDVLKVYPNIDSLPADFTSLSDPSGKYQRFVITISGTTTKLYIDGTLIGSETTPAISTTASVSYIGQYNSDGFLPAKLSDVQIYDVAWTQADVTFDYENPQHLVTDRAASSITLSNLKGYWHLSEGAGSFAYNSAVALGSELVTGWTNSDFDSFTSSGSNITQMVSGASGDNCYSNSLTVTSGKTYKVEFTSSQNLSTNCQVRAAKIQDMSQADVVSSSVSAGLNTFVFTATDNRAYIGFRATNSFTDTQITNFSFKEVSAGVINGATASPQQATIPQLGLMDWSKPTIGSDVVTLISDPNDPSKDILDNSVRLREHSLNLDGSGYAQVADDNSINPTDAITVECWIYWTDAVTDKGIVAKWISSGGQDYMLYKQSATKFTFYIGATNLTCTTALSNGWNYIVGTYDKTNIKVYLNDSLDGTQAHTSAITNTTQVLDIGRYENSVAKSYSERIDDVRIYNRALSLDEVKQNYNAGLNQHKTGSSFSDDFSSDYGL